MSVPWLKDGGDLIVENGDGERFILRDVAIVEWTMEQERERDRFIGGRRGRSGPTRITIVLEVMAVEKDLPSYVGAPQPKSTHGPLSLDLAPIGSFDDEEK